MVLQTYSEGNIDDEFLPVIAQIIRRNGNLYHSDNIPYTPSNPCFKKTTYDPFNAGLTAKGSSCCKKFGEAIYAPTTPPPITPTKPNDFCVKYYSKTNLSDNSAALNVEYQIAGQNPKHRINVWFEYFAKEFSELQFEAYSTDTFSYSCLQVFSCI
uniref:Uncharacterized protein n=1 Tax=Panagrolaimus davidi TaxID=227884 RepID=A0A914Q0D1_9BILA